MSVGTLVLLHGWGGDSRGWRPLIDALDAGGEGDHKDRPYESVIALDLPGFGDAAHENWPDDETLLRELYQRLPHNCLLIGHSLGGMLAAKLAALPGEKIRGLITIGANGRFVAGGDWPGMPAQTFVQFQREMQTEPAATWEKFCGLQACGDRDMRRTLKQLKQWPPQINRDAWLAALDSLVRWDNRELLRNLPVPALHLLGERDALVPAAVAELIGAQAELLAGCGHAPQISSPERVAEKIQDFMRANTSFAPNVTDFTCGSLLAGDCGYAKPDDQSPASRLPQGEPCARPPFSKTAVARSFARAAASYDAAAHLQRAVCRQLLGQLGSGPAPRRILDLGSGTGYGSELLRARFPRAEIIALDIAGGMLEFARRERPAADQYVVGDAEQLPLADGCVDLVFSSMALQWCYRLAQLFAELKRVLAPGGRALVSTLGPGTLRELKASWAQVDGGVHVNRFLPREQWLAAAHGCGLGGALCMEERVLHFSSALELMRELKNIGAHNVNRDAGRGLLGRDKLRRLAAAYEPRRTQAGLPASYEVMYLQLARAGRGQLTLLREGEI